MLGICDRTLTWQLICLLTVLASSLSIPLTGDGSVTATRLADTSGCEDQIDVRQDIVHAVRMMFNATRMQNYRRLCSPVKLRSLDDLTCRHAGDLGCDLRRVFRNQTLRFFPII